MTERRQMMCEPPARPLMHPPTHQALDVHETVDVGGGAVPMCRQLCRYSARLEATTTSQATCIGDEDGWVGGMRLSKGATLAGAHQQQ